MRCASLGNGDEDILVDRSFVVFVLSTDVDAVTCVP